MTGRTWIGFGLAFAIGIACRLSGIPLPAPPVLVGALLVLAMTVGYALTDWLTSRRAAFERHLCGGPSGHPGAEPP